MRRRLITFAAFAVLIAPLVLVEIPGRAVPGVEGRVLHSFLATGDTGHPARIFSRIIDGQHAVGRSLQREHRLRPVAALLLLGDNFYMDGLTAESLVGRVRDNLVRPYCELVEFDGDRSAEVSLDCPGVAKAPPPIVAVLGNHDTRLPESARLQHSELPRYVSNWDLPAAVVETREIVEGVSLILLESEKRRTEADRRALTAAIQGAAGPWRILVTHRPAIADQGHYGRFVRDAIRDAGVPVHAMLAGHVHSIRLVPGEFPNPALQVITGSGSRTRTPRYAVADAVVSRVGLGFSRIDLVERGGVQELVVTLVEVPPLPFLGFLGDRALARWAVDLDGRARDIGLR